MRRWHIGLLLAVVSLAAGARYLGLWSELWSRSERGLHYVCLDDASGPGCGSCAPYFASLSDMVNPEQVTVTSARSPAGFVASLRHGVNAPAVIVLSESDEFEGAIVGCLNSEDFARQVRGYESGQSGYSRVRRTLDSNAHDLDALLDLFWLQHVTARLGDPNETAASIRAADAAATSRAARFIKAREVIDALSDRALAGELVGERELRTASDKLDAILEGEDRIHFFLSLSDVARAVSESEMELQCLELAWKARNSDWETTLRTLLLAHPEGDELHRRCEGL